MNTIIYLYRGKDDTNFKIEKLDQVDYCLIRLGLPMPLWKHIKQMDKEKQDKPENLAVDEHMGNPEGAVGEYSVKGSVSEGSLLQGTGKEISVAVTVTERRIGKRTRPKPKKDRFLRRKENSILKRRRSAGRNAARDGLEDAGNHLADTGRECIQESYPMDEEEATRQEVLRQEVMRQEAQKQETLRKEALRQQITALLAELESLQTAICLLGGNTYWTYTVYEERLKIKIDTSSWWDAWEIPEFEDYSQPLWAEKILLHGDCPNFLILGQSDCIPSLLMTNARRLRSVKWYFLQKEYTEETEAFIDSFYEEYGLAIEVHLLEETKDWWRACFHCPEPVKVLDFTGEAKVSAYGVAKGSIWLDMNAMDEKSGRMEVRNQGIEYFSLKKLWAQLQKPVNTLTLL